MSVQNRLAAQSANAKVVEYECNGQIVKISPNIIKNYLVNGNGNVTDQEVVMFLNLCKFQKLNPFLREAYLIKYGNQPATIVTGKEAITKRAMRNPNYAGQQAGVVVLKEDGTLENRVGTIVIEGEMLVGGWAKVFVKGYEHPIEMTVSFEEYAGRKSDGTINGQWQKKPATMIRKVALVQALREAFPEDLSGMYSSEERGIDDNILSEEIINTEAEVIEDAAPTEAVQPEAEANDVQQALFG
jgi:phage recombination protein Bet